MRDSRTYKSVDRVLYVFLGWYLVINVSFIFWYIAEGGRPFDKAVFMATKVPLTIIVLLIFTQIFFRELRFSALANVVAVGIVTAFALTIYLIAGYASVV